MKARGNKITRLKKLSPGKVTKRNVQGRILKRGVSKIRLVKVKTETITLVSLLLNHNKTDKEEISLDEDEMSSKEAIINYINN